MTRFTVRWDRILGSLAVGVVIGYLAFLMLMIVADQPEPWLSLPLCVTEDSDNCRWDADEQGNGQGRSFYTVDGVTTIVGEAP